MKNLQKLGRTLKKAEMQQINGGYICDSNNPNTYWCDQQYCDSVGGVWYGCVGQCFDPSPHLPPC